MRNIIYLNGKFTPESEARVSIHDRGFLYGDGLFDTMRAYRGAPFRIEDHLERLFKSAGELEIKIETDSENIIKIVGELLSRNGLSDAYLRITVTRGEHTGDLSFSALQGAHVGAPLRGRPAGWTNSSTMLIVAKPVQVPSAEDYDSGVSAALVHNIHNPAELACYKTLSYLPYLLAREKARHIGAREAILVDSNGRILETSTGNIFVVRGDVVITPPISAGILPGIARKTVLELLPSLGLRGKEESLTIDNLNDSDEVFVTNSIVEVLSINRVDTGFIRERSGETTRSIAAAYGARVEEYIESWDLDI